MQRSTLKSNLGVILPRPPQAIAKEVLGSEYDVGRHYLQLVQPHAIIAFSRRPSSMIRVYALHDIYQRLLEIKKIFPIMYGHYGFRSLMLDYLFGSIKLLSDGTSKSLQFFKVYKSLKSNVDTCEK